MCWIRILAPAGLAAAATLLPTTAGCSNDEDPGRRRGEVIHLTVVAEARDDPTWAIMEAASRWFAKQERFVKVEVLAPRTRSPREQRALLEGLVGGDVDAVCVAPTDAAALRQAIDRLSQSGISVVTVGRDVPGSNRVTYCGPSELEIGRAAAEACVAAVQERSQTVMLLHAGPDDPVYGDRQFGFMRELPLHEGVTLLREVNCSQDSSEAVALVRLESRKYPRTGCWVFLEDWPLRTVQAVDRLLPRGCGIVLCNGSPRYWGLIREGLVVAVITYDHRQVMEKALEAAARLAQGGDTRLVAPKYLIPVEIVTIRNLPLYEARWEAWQTDVPSAVSLTGDDD
jgi:ABC-type sugar transport system substrate-binding protein